MTLIFFIIDTFVSLAFVLDSMTRKRLPIRRSYMFNHLLVCQIYCMGANLWASFFNERPNLISAYGLTILNMMYIIGFIVRAYLFYLYSIYVLQMPKKPSRILSILGGLLAVFELVFVITSIHTSYIFYVDAQGFHRGDLAVIMYLQTIVYTLIGLLMFIQKYKIITFFQRCMYILHLGIILSGIVIRMNLERHVGMGLIGIVAIAFIYMAFEDPNIYAHRDSIMFNANAFDVVLKEYKALGPFSFFGFRIKGYRENIEIHGKDQMDEAVGKIGEQLIKYFPHTALFYNDGSFAILSKKQQNFVFMRDRVENLFTQGWKVKNTELYFTPIFAAIDESYDLSTSGDIIQSVKNALVYREKLNKPYDTKISKEEFEKIRQELHIKRILSVANQENLMRMYLQPIVEAKTGKVVGAEALMRLVDEEGNILYPDTFIPIAETNGKINELGTNIYTCACGCFSKYNEDIGLEWVNVNLSPIQCLNPGLPALFESIARKHMVSMENIHLEITEESMISTDRLIEFMEDMEKRGFRFSLDDYGSGYSNILRMKNLPFLNLKLDKKLVWEHFKSPDKTLPTVIRGLKHMGYTITAEGVETEEMVRELSHLGVDFLQGYYFSKPIPAEEFVEIYSKKDNS